MRSWSKSNAVSNKSKHIEPYLRCSRCQLETYMFFFQWWRINQNTWVIIILFLMEPKRAFRASLWKVIIKDVRCPSVSWAGCGNSKLPVLLWLLMEPHNSKVSIRSLQRIAKVTQRILFLLPLNNAWKWIDSFSPFCSIFKCTSLAMILCESVLLLLMLQNLLG